MSNIYQSNNYLRQKYLRMDIWNHKRLTFKDYTIIAESEIYEDIYVSQQSIFIIPNKYHEFGMDGNKKLKVKIKADQGDIVRVKNEYGKTIYLGIIFSIEDFEPVESFKIICKPIMSILDVKFFYNGFETKNVAEEMNSLINKNLKEIKDNEFNKEYIKVEIDEEVKNIQGAVPFEKPKEIILWDFFRTLYDNFELYLDFSMEFTKENTENFLHIKITKKSELATKLKNNFADLQNLFIDDLYKQTPNRLDIYKETGSGKFEIEESWILKKKIQKQSKEWVVKMTKNLKDNERMYPEVIKTVLSKDIIKDDKNKGQEKSQEEKEKEKRKKYEEYANAQLKGNTYSHMIEFDLVRTTSIINVSQIKLYDKFILYINGRVYETVLSGIKQSYERSNLTRFIFGKARIRLGDKLKISKIFEK